MLIATISRRVHQYKINSHELISQLSILVESYDTALEILSREYLDKKCLVEQI